MRPFSKEHIVVCFWYRRTVCKVVTVLVVQHQLPVQCEELLPSIEFNQPTVEQYGPECAIRFELSDIEVQKVLADVC